MSTNCYTRESLLAEWEQIHPSEPMSPELQELFLNYTSAFTARQTVQNRRPNLIQADTPPPQRFQRRATARGGHDSAPPGPSKPCNMQVMKTGSLSEAFDSLPQGPEATTLTCWHEPDELDLSFEAINRKN